MKVRKHILIEFGKLSEFARDHIDETFKIYDVKATYIDLVQEVEQSEAEMHMEHLHTLLEVDEYLTEEEKAAIEYAIECIKTLDDMGIIRENKDDD